MLKNKAEKNYQGGEAYRLTPELELYTAVVTSSLSNKFYEEKEEQMLRISNLVSQVSPEFVAKLAVYTRTQMNLRSIPLLLIVLLSKIHNGDDLVARTIEKTVLRADEIAELLMCYQLLNPSEGEKKLAKLSRQIQNGLKSAFNRFDEYQFAKYDRSNAQVQLRDALFLVHPKAKDDKQQELFDKIAQKKLEIPYTWETELSALGQQKFESQEEKTMALRAKWEELIFSGKVGYMALLRNLRNMLNAQVSGSAMNHVADLLADEHQVKNSKQLPFRFLSAYREIKGIESVNTQYVMSALETAIKHSTTNIEGFDEQTSVLLACDVSGSMNCSISSKSTLQYYDIGILLAMLFKTRCKSVISGIFGNKWEVVNMPSDNILMATDQLKNLANKVGFSTNGYKVIDYLIDNKKEIDKVMFFTDMQLWDSDGHNTSLRQSWERYKQRFPKSKLYLFDLCGYGVSPLKIAQPDVYIVSGWSDRVFDVLSAIEKGTDAIEFIKKVKI